MSVENISIQKTRVDFLDVAKGIGVLFVVLGHNNIRSVFPIVDQIIYSFHMPFFFLLSGMFFKPDESLSVIIQKRFRGLLLPFLSGLLALYLSSLFFSNIQFGEFFYRMAKSLYASPAVLDWAPLWFLPHLFLVNLFAWMIFRFYGRISAWQARLVFIFSMLWAGVALIKPLAKVHLDLFGHTYKLPGLFWSADILLITTAFFMLGYEIYKHLPEDLFSSRKVWVMSALIFFILNIAFQDKLNFYANRYDSFIIVTLEALGGSIALLCTAHWINKHQNKLSSALKYLGAASIVLLIFHQPIQQNLYGKINVLDAGTYVAALISFIGGVLIPLGMYRWLIQPNAVLAKWFGVHK